MKDPVLITRFPECDIFYNEDLNAIQTSWNGHYCEGPQLQTILDAIIDAMKLKNTGIVIADARKMQVISREDQDWISSDWYPRALDAGFAYEALVVTQYTFNEVTVKRIVRTYDDRKVRTGYFRSLPSAFDWVQNNFPEEGEAVASKSSAA